MLGQSRPTFWNMKLAFPVQLFEEHGVKFSRCISESIAIQVYLCPSSVGNWVTETANVKIVASNLEMQYYCTLDALCCPWSNLIHLHLEVILCPQNPVGLFKANSQVSEIFTYRGVRLFKTYVQVFTLQSAGASLCTSNLCFMLKDRATLRKSKSRWQGWHIPKYIRKEINHTIKRLYSDFLQYKCKIRKVFVACDFFCLFFVCFKCWGK